MRNKVISVLLFPLVILLGCPAQNTLAALTQTLGTSAANIAQLEGNSTLSTKLTTDTAAAVSAIQNWKSGSASTEAIEALNLVEDDLNLIPGTSQYAPLVDLAIGTVESIITILAPSAPASTVAHANVAKRHVTLANPPKNASAYKKQFNSIAKQYKLSITLK